MEKNAAALEQVKRDELPAELQGLTRDEMGKKVQRMSRERRQLQAEIEGLNKERVRYIAEHGKASKDSFDAKLVDSLKEQAARKGIAY